MKLPLLKGWKNFEKRPLSVTATVGIFLTLQGGTGVSGAVLDQLRDDLQVLLSSGRSCGSGSKLSVGKASVW